MEKEKTLTIMDLQEGVEYKICTGSPISGKAKLEDDIFQVKSPAAYKWELIDLTPRLVKEMRFLKITDSAFANANSRKYYCIDSVGEAVAMSGQPHLRALQNACAYGSFDFAKWKARELSLLNTLQKFSYDNNGFAINWNDDYQAKFFISLDYDERRVGIESCKVEWIRQPGQVYFYSREIAEIAAGKFYHQIAEVYFEGF